MGKSVESLGWPTGAPGFAHGSGAPGWVKSGDRKVSGGNGKDPASKPAPDSGQTAGGSRQGGRGGSNSPKE